MSPMLGDGLSLERLGEVSWSFDRGRSHTASANAGDVAGYDETNHKQGEERKNRDGNEDKHVYL